MARSDQRDTPEDWVAHSDDLAGDDQGHDQGKAAVPASATPGKALVKPFTSAELDELLAPHAIDMRSWLTTLMTEAEFPEQSADESTFGMLAAILTAGDVDEMFAAMQMERAKVLAGNEPGGKSFLMQITGARPMKSTFEEGPGVFAIFQAVEVASGRKFQFTTGARAVQAAVAGAMVKGWMPLTCLLTIRRQATQRGYYPLNLEQGG